MMGLALMLVCLALPPGWAWWQRRSSKAQPEEQWWHAAARFFYFAGLPYLALTSGVLTPRLLGLKGLENLAAPTLSSNGIGAGLQKAVTLLLLESLADSSLLLHLGLPALLLAALLRWSLSRHGLASESQPWLHTLYDGLHWAFYRAVVWQWSGDLYVGVVWGVVLMWVEWALTLWAQGNQPFRSARLWQRTIILILTSMIFFYSPNLWLLWPLHLALAAMMGLPGRRRERVEGWS
ncbi:MAG: hypothetical protein U0401_16015 [Anaerolineae bacterium]